MRHKGILAEGDERNLDISRSCSHWEKELATTLRGLGDVESVTGNLQRAILELKRHQVYLLLLVRDIHRILIIVQGHPRW